MSIYSGVNPYLSNQLVTRVDNTSVLDLNCAEVGNHVPATTGLWLLALEFLVVLVVVCVVYGHFGSFRDRPWWCTVIVIFGWANTMMVAFMIPNDLQSTNFKGCTPTPDDPCEPPFGLVAWQSLVVAWRAQYLMGLVITYILAPFTMNYSHSAEFTVARRLLNALKDHIIVYGSLLLLGAIGLIYIAVRNKLDMEGVEGIILIVSLSWAMFLLVCFLGFGLEQIPRTVWRTSIPERNMKYYQYRASELSNALEESEYKLNSTLKLLRKVDEMTSPQDPYRPYIEIIISKCESYYAKVLTQGGEWHGASYKALVELHEKVLHRLWKLERTQALLQRNFDQAFEQEDTLRASAYNRTERPGGWKRIPWQFREVPENCCTNLGNSVEYYWYVYLQPYILKICALLAALISLTFIWSETTLWSNQENISIPSLSPFYYIVKYSSIRYISGMLIVFALIVYLMVCAFSSLLKFRLFDYYHILPHHQSDAHSLLFSAAWLCRLILPITYNFLLLLNAFHKQRKYGCEYQTAFETIFLHMGPIADQAAIYLPILVIIFALLSLFDISSKIMKMLGIKYFSFNKDTDNDDHIVYGRDLIDRQRSIRQQVRSASAYERFRTDASVTFLTNGTPRLPASSTSVSNIPARFVDDDVFVPSTEPLFFEDDHPAPPPASKHSVADFIAPTPTQPTAPPPSVGPRSVGSFFSNLFGRSRNRSPSPEFMRDDFKDDDFPPRSGSSSSRSSSFSSSSTSSSSSSSARSRSPMEDDWGEDRDSSFSRKSPRHSRPSWDEI